MSEKKNYDKRASKNSCHVNDEVWLYNQAVPRGSSRKLPCPRQGPFRITKRIGEVLYHIQDENKKENCVLYTLTDLSHLKDTKLRVTIPYVPKQNIAAGNNTSNEEEPTSSDSDDDMVEPSARLSTTDNSDSDGEDIQETILHRCTRQICPPDWYVTVMTLQTSDSGLDD